jgi:cyclohexa-1,5-dienecarbonyl-CoA hydratase
MTPLRIRPARGGAHVRLILDRPNGNIVNAALVTALRRTLDELRGAAGLKLVTLEGAGDDFSFGASIEEHAPGRIDAVLPDLHAAVRDLLDVAAPTMAVVRGRCLGGGFELALACDLILAADDARLGLPEIRLGVFPPAGAALLPARIGASRAAAAILSGEPRPAAWWAAAGLIERIVPAGDLDGAVDAWFGEYAAPRSSVALRHAAMATRQPVRRALEADLGALEAQYLTRLMRSHDAAEGVAAFLERRPPQWRNA